MLCLGEFLGDVSEGMDVSQGVPQGSVPFSSRVSKFLPMKGSSIHPFVAFSRTQTYLDLHLNMNITVSGR